MCEHGVTQRGERQLPKHGDAIRTSYASTSDIRSLLLERWIRGRVDPVRRLCGHVARETIFLQSVDVVFMGFPASNHDQPHPFPHSMLPGWLLLLSFTITNQPFKARA